MKTAQLRETFLNYFLQQGHTIVPSSSLVPQNDPTLLFTNAGMVQFKEIFLGLETRSYTRATSSQRCVRAGGKHNDLENVGYTARHHTFFEMLGNFSFGDYFKAEAIAFAWEFLTQVLKLSPERLWITVFKEDKEAEEIWLNKIKIDPKRFSRCDAKDNFWSMGDTGPCGPCTEIYFDHGPQIPGGPPGSEIEGDRYVEIWNLVFMQYNRSAEGILTPLPKPSVDTGMGLERTAAVLQGVHSNYEIDIFKDLIAAIAKLGNIKDTKNHALQVISDHIRSCAFLIMDGILPSNEGRGYVLRRIARRAIRHGHQLGFKDPFFHQLVLPLAAQMGEVYPELQHQINEIERVLYQEELQFARTLEQGLKILQQDIGKVSGNLIAGETVFKLYDTYGFPVDLTADIAREQGLTLDIAGFNKAMEQQRSRAREASQFGLVDTKLLSSYNTRFIGYELLSEEAEIIALYKEGKEVPALHEGEKGTVILNHTPFYAESGGQVGDQGTLLLEEGGIFEVHNTRKIGEASYHEGILKKSDCKVGDFLRAQVDAEKRKATALNHSATHLLHAALRQVLGSQVQQKGSLVESERLRFDFSYSEPLTSQQRQQIERLVNNKIQENSLITTDIMPIEQAVSKGALALFGEKYGKDVRVLNVGNSFSIELCGGTHASRTGDIGLFKITEEYGVAAGIRRLEALTGLSALQWLEEQEKSLNRIAVLLKCSPNVVEEKVQQLMVKLRQLEKEVQQLKENIVSGNGSDLAQTAQIIQGIKIVAAKLPIADSKTLRDAVDRLKNQLESAVIVLGGVEATKVNLVVGVTANCTDKIKAVELIQAIAKQIGGQGGGRADMAQAGGSQPEQLEAALASVYGWIQEKLNENPSKIATL